MAAGPRTLIEDWLPLDVIGAESMRERGASSALPPLYFLHVWWARRPLAASRAAILASVLPGWSSDWPKSLHSRFPTEETYRAWFLRACGILGDPVAGRRRIQRAKDLKIKLSTPPYTHPRAFTVSPSPETLKVMGELLHHSWGKTDLSVLDAFAGGGSIPFEALRYGFRTYANELNPVASVILKATLDFPARFGPSLENDIRKYGKILADRMRERLGPFFPVEPGESIHAYIWARTVRCPYTSKPIPLSPNWWLSQGGEPVAVRPIFEPRAAEAAFEIVTGKRACQRVKPDQGTVSRGDAVSPWAHNQPVDGDYIKTEARAGRMGQQLYALAIKTGDGLAFKSPTNDDLQGASEAARELKKRLPGWEAQGLVPREAFPEGNDLRPLHYGMPTFGDFFSPRQLLALCTYLELFQALRPQIEKDLGETRAVAAHTYLALPLDKAADYNSRMARWHSSRSVVVNTFDRHDFSFKWSHAEFDAAHNLIPWVIDQVADAYRGIAALAGSVPQLFGSGKELPIQIRQGPAANLQTIPDSSIDHICVDPPYEANVMYAECSDFFYVWQKRSLGALYPAFFHDALTNKDDEAVANPARFADMGKKRKDLALADYERKMAASFREMHRVLTDEGILTVMFTHKKVEAWDTLGSSLIGAGFSIRSSWPVHTESEHSLHQAKKNSAQSTILLSCRKRLSRAEPIWWEDLKGQVRRVAREKAAEFERQGIRGVDLYIATFGPTLSILSDHWPVLTAEVDERTGDPKPLRPEMALDLAREEVVALRKQGLLLGRAVQFDAFTDWYLLAWDAFQAEQFPGGEALKLALSLGLDLEAQVVSEKRLVAKRGASVILQSHRQRRRRGTVDPEVMAFACWVDAAHTAMLVYDEDGARACQAFLKRTGLLGDATFKACLQALLNAIPRTKEKGEFVRSEAKVLDALRLAFFEDLTLPAEPDEAEFQPLQLGLVAEGGAPYRIGDDEEAEAEDDEESEDD